MAKQYRVTAPCIVNVPVSSEKGAQLTTFYRDALLPEGVPAERIKHLLDSNLIAEAKDDAPKQKAPAKQEAPKGDGQQQPSVNSRSSKAELVEHGVAQGDDRAALEELTRDQLLDRYVRPQQ